MPRRYFNWKLASILLISLIVLGITAFGVRNWQRNRTACGALEKGNEAYEKCQWEEAAKNLGRYIAVTRDDVSALLRYAEAQLNIRPLKQNNIQQSIAAYRTVLRIDKGNSEAALTLVKIYLQMQMPGEAELIATRALGREPALQKDRKIGTQTNQSSKLRRMLAIALASQRKFKQAEEQAISIIKEHPEQISAYEILGQLIEQRAADFSKAPQFWFDEAVRNNRSSALAYIIRAGFYLRSQDRIQATADLEQAEKQDLSDPVVRLRLAREFINANALDKAEEHLAVAQKVEPTNQALWQIWAQLAMKSNSKTIMMKVAENGLKELLSQPWDFMPTATELFIRCGELEHATECISKLRQKDIAPATTAFLGGLLADKKGQGYEAIKCWRRAMQLGNKSPQVRLALASAFSRLGDAQSALQQLRPLVSEQPNFFDGRLALAKLLAQTGNWAEAVEQIRWAIQLSPENLEAALLLLQARMQLLAASSTGEDIRLWQDIEKQLANLEKATNSALEVKILQFQLAMQRGNFTGAEALVAELKKAHPSQIKVALAESELLVGQHKTNEAILVLNKTIEEFPKSVQLVRYLAILSAQQGEHAKCERVIKDTLARIGEPIARRELGLLLAQMYTQWGRRDNVYPLLNSLAEELPNDVSIKRRLLRCEQVIKNLKRAQQLVDDIKTIEGEESWRWRYEQARIWLAQGNFKKQYPQIVSLLKENLLVNLDDQTSRLLLAAVYERAGELRLAVSTYEQALNRSPRDLRMIVPAVAALYKANEYDRADKILRRVVDEKLVHPELKKLQLQSYLRRGQLSSASDILENLLANDPNNRSICLSLALLKMRQSRFAEADELLTKLKTDEPNSLPIAVAQIELNVRQHKPAEALLLCDEIVNKFNNASAYILRARTYAMLDRIGNAQKDFKHATVIEPNKAETWIAKSDFYRSIGQLDKAVADIQRAMSLDPNSLVIQKRVVLLFLASNDRNTINQGTSILDNALTANPEDVELRLYKARSLLTEGTAPAIQKATHILRAITEDQPNFSDGWALLAEIALRQGQSAKAMDITLRGLAHRNNDKSLLLLKARAEAARSPALAIPTLKALRELDPKDIDVVVRLANTYLAVGSSEKAMNVLKTQLTSCSGTPDERKVNIALAVALHKNGNKQEAQEMFNLLLQSAPDDPGPLLAHARLLKDDKLWSQLNQMVANWCQSHPKDTHTPITIANELVAQKNTEAQKLAEDLLREVLERNTNLLPAMNTLAMLLQSTGRFTESAELYQQILTLQPDNVIAINNLAWIMCEEQGKYQQALELTQRGLRTAPNYVDLIDTRGVVYYRLGQYKKAIEDFTKCLELYPDGTSSVAASYLHLGRASARLGQKDNAVKSLKKALELNTKIGGLSAADMTETRRLLEELSQGV